MTDETTPEAMTSQTSQRADQRDGAGAELADTGQLAGRIA